MLEPLRFSVCRRRIGRSAVSRIFINYRRSDASANASRLYEWLSERYGDEQVFMDVDAIEPGLDWAEAIERAVASSDLVLAVIGNDWLAELKVRADSEDDYVRHELEAALRRDVRIMPILVEGAAMPRSAELPESLASLARRSAFEIRDERFRSAASTRSGSCSSSSTFEALSTVKRSLDVGRSPC